jgi:hypothetical protein
MSFKSLAASMASMAKSVFGTTATVTPPNAEAILGVGAIIDKGAEVIDEYGVVADTRIEVELFRAEVGGVERGTLVQDDETGETFRLLEPIDTQGEVMRWVAAQV